MLLDPRNIQIHAAVRRTAAGFHFAVDAARHVVAGQQLGRPARILVPEAIPPALLLVVRGLGFVQVGDIVEHEAPSFAVAQHAPFPAHTLRHQQAAHADRPHHAGRMKLHELHVLQLGPGTIGQCVAVACVLPTVAGDLEGPADASRRHHDGFRFPQDEMPFFAIVSERAGNPAAVQQQGQHGALHVDFHAAVNPVVLQRADHLQAGAVAHVRQPRIAMPAEIALQNAAVPGAVEERAPGFEFPHPLRRFLGMQLRHPPVVQVLAAAHRIGEMHPPVVAVIDVGERRRHPAFRHHGVGFAEQRLAHHPDGDARSRRFNRCTQSRPARSDDQDVIGAFLIFEHLQDSPVVPDAHRAKPHIHIGEAYRTQTCPRPLLMTRIQAARAVVQFVTHRMPRDLIERSADQVAERVAAEDVASQQHHVDAQHDGADSDAEAIVEPERLHRVVDQKAPHNVGEPQKMAVKVLQDQRKAALAEIGFARLAYRARRRIGPERLVVRTAVVVAGEPEQAGNPEDQQRGREGQEIRKPRRLRTEPGMR